VDYAPQIHGASSNAQYRTDPVLASLNVAERRSEGVVAGRTQSKLRMAASFYAEMSKIMAEG
jgi:hypothetical protein